MHRKYVVVFLNAIDPFHKQEPCGHNSRPSGLFLWFWHQDIYTIQKEENINVNFEFYA